MMSFLYRKTQSGSSTKAVIFLWKEATGSPQAPASPTPLCCWSSSVLLHNLPPPTSQDLSGKDTSVNPLAFLQFLIAVKQHCMERKEHFLDWESPDTYPNRTSEQSFCSGELYCMKGSGERKTVLRRWWSVKAWALLQFTLIFLASLKCGPASTGEVRFASKLHSLATTSSKIQVWVC